MAQVRILLAEDDDFISGAVGAFLRDAGYMVDVCEDGDDALAKIYDNKYQLAIFDIMLPGMDGYGLLREFRRLSDAPVLMLTALSGDDEQLRAFDGEADDYVTKPFKIRLLLGRVQALLRRSGALAKEIRCGRLTLFPDDFCAACAGERLALTRKEFEILLLLAGAKGRTLTHETILSRVWGYEFGAEDAATVHTHIKNLRAKLPENSIVTVRGVGYRLEEGP